ncbi:uncharacterized protein GGS22DRAFT_46390 [Annulohypoxylon maeteangense]|uniref:uncharacterized protein n=1 Tax=Annulohypoxylon maeteangense TaxID=1927788 RepID=UPI0020076514|nr:uncharacterized protein GGS22DRAFT_46390 [Annulohypoxylon maeteangense]KAI0882574.1 hypothetical protein GGS22DRAFT_46390 [Annulohypoxylon maeteangense]
MQIRSFLVAALAAGTATAHMNMKDPPPLAYKGNPNAKEPNIDYSITSPITQAQYPCKGYLKLLGTPEGASVKTYAPGGQYSMSVEGGAAHNGGSCQLSLSYDKGTSFTVIKSFIGNCPTSSGGTFNFGIPSDAPEGDDVVFAWTWVNHTGNREYYMSCAVVTIKAGATKRGDVPTIEAKRATTAFASRPKVFEANLGGQYCTKEGVDTVYPEPGPDVENTSTSPGPAILCSSGADVPAGSSSGGSGSGSGSSAGASSAAATSAAATSAAATSAAATSAATSSPATSAAGGGIQISASMYVSSSSRSTPASSASSATSSGSPEVLTVIPITGLTSSSTGGVFVTVAPSSTGAAATSAPSPTTFSTATKPSQSVGAGTGASSSAAAGGNTGSATTSAKAPVGTGGAAGTQSGACTDEGAWSCAPDGSSFQRCASGLWSAAMPMAQGTKCSPGVSNTLSLARRSRVRRSGTGLSRVAF